MSQIVVDGVLVRVDCDVEDGVKSPISLNLCLSGDEELKSSRLECYYYTIMGRKDDVLGIPLRDTSSDWIRDLARLCATMITKKYNKPCYVTISTVGENNFQASTIPLLAAVKEHVATLVN